MIEGRLRLAEAWVTANGCCAQKQSKTEKKLLKTGGQISQPQASMHIVRYRADFFVFLSKCMDLKKNKPSRLSSTWTL